MLVWAILAGLVAWGLWRVFGGYPAPAEPPRVLARRELALVAAAADAMFPPGGEIPPSGSEVGIPAYSDRYVAAVDPGTRRLMRLLFFLVEHATLFFPAPGLDGWRRFSALSAEQRVAVLDGWRRSRLFPRRLVFTSLRAILTMGYFAAPVVLRRLGLAPKRIDTPVVEADLLYPPVGRAKDAIRYGQSDLTPPGPRRPLDVDGPLHPAYAEDAA
jgi:hypothetical protein